MVGPLPGPCVCGSFSAPGFPLFLLINLSSCRLWDPTSVSFMQNVVNGDQSSLLAITEGSQVIFGFIVINYKSIETPFGTVSAYKKSCLTQHVSNICLSYMCAVSHTVSTLVLHRLQWILICAFLICFSIAAYYMGLESERKWWLCTSD